MTEPDSTAASPTDLAPTSPVPPTEVVPYAAVRPERKAEIERAMSEIELTDSNSILFFGTAAQDEVTSVADEMLEGVRHKDTGPAGRALNEMVKTLRDLPVDDLDPKKKRGLLSRLLGRAKPVARVLQRYGQVRTQVDAISNRLDAETGGLMKDIAMLDRLYDRTVDYFDKLAVYIAAGE
ncbi:MAG: toxic anion resistance protein, partial [Vicinamibacteraceae bacterium]